MAVLEAEHLKKAIEAQYQALPEGEEAAAIAHLVAADGTRTVALLALPREDWDAVILKLAQENEAQEIALSAESWGVENPVEGMQPSLDPRRVEVVLLAITTKDGSEMHIADLTRTADGTELEWREVTTRPEGAIPELLERALRLAREVS